jgi:parallel beta-helix repeat protein
MLGGSTTGGYVTACRIEGNKIGTNALGAGASGVSNLGNGVTLRGHSTSDNLIQDNVISGNGADGLHLRDNTHHNTILGNRIGTDAAGTASLGNGQNGVRLDGTDHNTVGSPAKGNVVSGNAQNGIHLREAVAELVQGNRVGTNAAGSAAIPNGSAGVALSASAGSNTIGGALPGEGNVISGNRGVGVDIANSPGNQLSGNWIGTSDTRAQLGNGGNGVTLSGASLANIIGGLSDGSGNTIAFNTGSGVQDAEGATGTQILGNSIFSNGLEGIFGNGRQSSPILTSANTSGGTTTVSGSLSQFDSPNAFFRIEFFRSAGCDASGSGEGEQLMGRTEVTTDGGGNAPFSVPFAAISGGVVTATATSPAIGTSGFSRCLVPDLALVVGDIRTIVQAEAAYQGAAAGWYGTLDCLATPSACISGYPPTGPAFLSPDLASLAPRAGYARAFSAGPGVSSPFLLVPGLTRWAYTAVPESGFGPAFCAQPDGGIFVRDDGVASAADGQCTSGGTPLP